MGVDNLVWGQGQEGGKFVSGPPAAEPNWAQKYGLTNFLDAAVKTAQDNFIQQQAVALQKQKDDADMARTLAHDETLKSIYGTAKDKVDTAETTLIDNWLTQRSGKTGDELAMVDSIYKDALRKLGYKFDESVDPEKLANDLKEKKAKGDGKASPYGALAAGAAGAAYGAKKFAGSNIGRALAGTAAGNTAAESALSFMAIPRLLPSTLATTGAVGAVTQPMRTNVQRMQPVINSFSPIASGIMQNPYVQNMIPDKSIWDMSKEAFASIMKNQQPVGNE